MTIIDLIGGAPSPCTHTISGSISLPFLGTFNLSLTVLVHYRSRNIFSLGGWPLRFQSGFLVSRPTRHTDLIFQSDPYKSKVRFTLHTRLSLSMARLSKRFCSLSEFLTLGRLMVAPAANTESTNVDSILVVCSVTTPFRYSSTNLFACCQAKT